jgi:hypothetical protein
MSSRCPRLEMVYHLAEKGVPMILEGWSAKERFRIRVINTQSSIEIEHSHHHERFVA